MGGHFGKLAASPCIVLTCLTSPQLVLIAYTNHWEDNFRSDFAHVHEQDLSHRNKGRMLRKLLKSALTNSRV